MYKVFSYLLFQNFFIISHNFRSLFYPPFFPQFYLDLDLENTFFQNVQRNITGSIAVLIVPIAAKKGNATLEMENVLIVILDILAFCVIRVRLDARDVKAAMRLSPHRHPHTTFLLFLRCIVGLYHISLWEKGDFSWLLKKKYT